ncbi:MAG TPA: hypothetical protein VFN87_13620 [Solirubrobacteraceae bacterium]|nr:hypothetical protein [Solirubrobacteraceae bacterium]
MVIASLAAGLAGCGEQSLPPATLAAQSYLNALAEGNYSNACALIDGRTRRRVARSLGRRVSCPGVFRRCLPDKAQVPQHDQSQLLFADVQVERHGNRAVAAVSGTAVATAIRQVTLAKEGRQWRLTSYGQGLRGCPAGRRRERRSARARASARTRGSSRSGA